MKCKLDECDLLPGHVPLYFVSRDMIKKILFELGEASLEEFHVNLSFEMGSVSPLYINPERMEICYQYPIWIIGTYFR